MTIYLLDMGLKQYGDCILITQGDRKILIDCGKPSDQSSIRLQLKKILRQDPPFKFDLLVLTHCHDDHIGPFPELIKSGEIKAAKYLLADPAYRWGEVGGTDSAVVRDGITEALLEEDHSGLSDSELEEFISDIEELVVRYRRMINILKDQGADVKLFRGVDADNYDALHKEFKDFGLEILGPTKNHLRITEEALLGARDGIADFISNSNDVDSISSTVDLYRKIFSDGTIDDEAFLDASKNSGSINNQSIVIKVCEEGFNALLAGDMQFAMPNVTGIEAEMKSLLADIFEKGPYDFIKTSHHTSDNGLSAAILDHWISEGTEFFAHSGGLRDEKHPDEEVLALLKARKSKIKFARTDRNGLIKVEKDQNGTLAMSFSKGKINTFTPNITSDTATPETEESGVAKRSVANIPPAGGQNTTALPTAKITQTDSAGSIELTAKIPADLTRVTITVEIDSEKKKH